MKYNVGRVEILKESKWGKINPNNWTRNFNASRVVCRQLGFQDAQILQPKQAYVNSTIQTIISSITCKGNELSINQCQVTTDPSGVVSSYGATAYCLGK